MLSCREEADVLFSLKKYVKLNGNNARRDVRQWTLYQLLYNTASPFVLKLCFIPARLLLDNKSVM